MFFLDELKNSILDEDFYKTNEILEKVYNEENAFDYISELLELMEENPELDYGMPGPVVHFMEKFYKNGYEKLLLASVKKYPTTQTVWMINRIINDNTLGDRTQYIQVLMEVSNRNDVPEEVRNEAKEFYNYQTRR